jgi:type IV secretion system protein VirB9
MAPNAQHSEADPVFEAAYIKAQPLPPAPAQRVVEIPQPVPVPGQLKKVEERSAPCPICVYKGVPPDQAKPDHTHDTHDIIDFANVQARQGPELHGYINSVQLYDYMPGALFQVYSAPISVTAIILQPGEHLTTYAAGDTVRWIVESTTSGQGDHERDMVLVKPLKPGLHTNMVITTDRRTYLLEMHSYQETYMAAVSWHYPHDQLVRMNHQAKVQHQRTQDIIAPQVNLGALYFGYDIKSKRGEPRWKPVRVFDDGRKTYIQFPANLSTTEAPALFILSGRKKTQLVNYRVKGTYYIVDRLFDRAELRVGEKKPDTVRIIRHAWHQAQVAAQDDIQQSGGR